MFCQYTISLVSIPYAELPFLMSSFDNLYSWFPTFCQSLHLSCVLPLSVTRRGKIFKGVARELVNISRVLDGICGVLGVLAVKFRVL